MTAVIEVKCRCGMKHQPRERAVPCSLCHTDTWDFHGICARCRGIEDNLAREADGRGRPGQRGRASTHTRTQAATP